MSYTFTLLFLFGAAITALLAMDYPEIGGRGAPYVLILASTIGMTFMASANDLIMLYLAIETVSIPMYILSGFLVRSDESTEAGFKYLLFGAMTSALLLYGFSLIYGFSGTTHLPSILQEYTSGAVPPVQIIATLILAIVGLGFKISVVPFHFWAPDVYQGAPTPVSGFLSTASKAAGFAALIRVLFLVFGSSGSQTANPVAWWMVLLAALSFATMTLGNLVAISQRNIKRLLAYSSIAHAGYVLIGVVSFGSRLGLASVMYYLGAYLITNLAAFAIVSAYGRAVGTDDVKAYNGLSRRSPGLALAMLVAFLSLAGMPPFAGFVAKVFIFAAAVDANQLALAIVGVLNSIVGLYYYLTVLKYVYLYRSENDDQPLPMSGSFKFAIGVLTVGIILVGVVFNPWFNWASTAAAAMVR
jgi:NADH-quinone oxidoreductase subunit N